MARDRYKVDRIDRTAGSRARRDAAGNRVVDALGYGEFEPVVLCTVLLSPWDRDDPAPAGSIEVGRVYEVEVR